MQNKNYEYSKIKKVSLLFQRVAVFTDVKPYSSSRKSYTLVLPAPHLPMRGKRGGGPKTSLSKLHHAFSIAKMGLRGKPKTLDKTPSSRDALTVFGTIQVIPGRLATMRILHFLLESFVLCQYACAEVGHASRCSCNSWCCQFPLQHGLAASVDIVLGKAECC